MPLSVFNARRPVKRSQRPRAVCALLVAGLLLGAPARAQPAAAPEPTRFIYSAPQGCGSAEDFSARVQKRSQRIRLVAEGTAPRSLSVEIQPPDAAGVLRGKVTVTEPDGATRARQLKASSCEEALEGLSLIATVTLDPEAMLGEPEPPPETPSSKPAPPPPKPAPKQPPAPAQTAPVETYRLSLGVGGAVLIRHAPEPAFGGYGSVALELRPGRAVSPFFRLSVAHAQLLDSPAREFAASFAYTLPALDICPVRLGPSVFGIRPCVYGSAGLLEVWGSGSRETETHERFFGSAGPALLVLVRLSKAIEITADGRLGVAFNTDEFAFDNMGFFTTPTLGFSSGIGIAGGFP